MSADDELWAYDEPHESDGNCHVTMTRRQAIDWFRSVYPIGATDDESLFSQWTSLHLAYKAESTLPAAAVRDALAESATIRDATIHDALEKLWVDVLRLPTADYSADGDGAKLTKQDVVLKFIADTRAALGLGAEGEKQ